jgi:hypothetical protein
MKKLILVALLAAAGSAHAFEEGSAEELNARVRMCKNYADLGALYYRMATVGGDRSQIAHKTGWSEPMRRHIENEIFDHTARYDQESAAQMGGLYCLDNAIRYLHGAQD